MKKAQYPLYLLHSQMNLLALESTNTYYFRWSLHIHTTSLIYLCVFLCT